MSLWRKEPQLKALFAVIGVVLAGCAQTLTLDVDGALAAVPYAVQEDGRILVDVHVNGRGPFPFALDTAASISFIFEAYRRELALETDTEGSATVHGIVASGEFPLLTIDRLRVGSEVWSNARFVSLPGETRAASAIAGILGIDFLRRYGVGFSAHDRVVRFYPPALVRDRSYRGWVSVPLEPRRIAESRQPLYFFEMEIGGRAIPALFDLGAGFNVINPPGASYLRLAPARVGPDSELSGVLGTAPVLARLQSEVTTSGARWRNEEFLIAGLEIFSTLMHEDRPLALVGAELFNQRDFVIDFVRNRLLVRVAMDEAARSPSGRPSR